MTVIEIPELCLVVLIGVTGAGKSTFAAHHFAPSEVVSSDAMRAFVADDPDDLDATADAFAVLGEITRRRLRRGLLTVVDATSLRAEDRQVWLDLARDQDVFAVAIVLDPPSAELNDRAQRRGRAPHVLARQSALLRGARKGLRKSGFRYDYQLTSVAEIADVTVRRTPLFNDKRALHGPFDVIGDVHGCIDELLDLLRLLGWPVTDGAPGAMPRVDAHPEGRTAIFVGDLVDRGLDTPAVLAVVMGMVRAGTALCVRGNHEEKLLRALRSDGRRSDGRRGGPRAVGRSTGDHGLAESLAQLAQTSGEFRTEVIGFLDGLVSHYVFDDDRLVVAHAGLAQRYHGRTSGRVRSTAMYGETTGETDRWGYPVRIDWARDYRGRAQVVYGHTPVPTASWVNNTLCVDTGCVFGGRLSALRYPERTVVSVPARATYYDPGRPLGFGSSLGDDLVRARLRLDDVLGKRTISTRYGPPVTVRAENAAAGLETLSRYAIDPRWLRYLPPTMSPVGSDTPDLLESPGAAFAHYRELGVTQVVCEYKHMGSRATLVLVADSAVAHRVFGVADGVGALYTRTGRAFFDADDTARILARADVAARPVMAGLGCDWMILDAEVLPWNIKGEGLIREHFAAVSAAARAESGLLGEALTRAADRGLDVAVQHRAWSRSAMQIAAFTDAYARHVQPLAGLDDVTIAPFEVLATGNGRGGQTWENRSHEWHLGIADQLAQAGDGLFGTTGRRHVDTTDEASCRAGESWWTELTAAGGEGMVVKPAANRVGGDGSRPIPPGVKVRGREYLRIIYGPDYLDNLDRLRSRDLRHKRSMAAREYRLGREALARHAVGDPLWQVHECVAGVLALESEPVDSRL